ncbi:MAG: LysR family transcriptional regulator [Pseudomonadota bacterium]
MNWDDLKLLLAIGRAGSVSGASRALRVHRATVLRRFDAMEGRLGARLCDRTPEGYRLTASGVRLFELAEKMEREVLAAEAAVAGEDERVEGVVRVTMPEPLASVLIAPSAARFRRRWPGLRMEILATMDMMDLARRDADIALRVTMEPPEVMVGRRFGGFAQALYAAPEKAGDWRAETPVPIVGWGGDTPDWGARYDLSETEVAASSAEVTVQAALARSGVGVACLPCFIGDADPALVRLGPPPFEAAYEIWLLTHPDLRRQARIDAAMTHLSETLTALRPVLKGEAAPGAGRGAVRSG